MATPSGPQPISGSGLLVVDLGGAIGGSGGAVKKDTINGVSESKGTRVGQESTALVVEGDTASLLSRESLARELAALRKENELLRTRIRQGSNASVQEPSLEVDGRGGDLRSTVSGSRGRRGRGGRRGSFGVLRASMPVFGGRLQAGDMGDKGELSVEENGGKSNAHLGLEQDCVARDNPCNDGSLAGVCKLDNQGLPSSSSFSVEAGQPSGLSGQLPCEGADPGMHSFHLGVAGGDKQSAKPTDLPAISAAAHVSSKPSYAGAVKGRLRSASEFKAGNNLNSSICLEFFDK